ncbi:Gustatory receptor 6c [Ladona fulva]|uniref:Gustatory receptor n=1 Tax=Ladona fulva TaxID=123851 RepID=A0A8K0P9S1_LADFU|nr:Gustatory receptor 6c [Ladona fulva]
MRDTRRKDLAWALLPMLTMNRLTGIPPQKNVNNSALRKWCSRFVHWIIVFISAYSIIYFTFVSLFFNESLEVSVLIKQAWVILDLTTGSVCYILYLFRHERTANVFTQIFELEKLLPMNFDFDVSRIRRFCEIQSVLWLSFSLNLILVSWRTDEDTKGFRIVTWIVVLMMFFNIIHTEFVWQFCNAAFLIRKYVTILVLEMKCWLNCDDYRFTFSKSRLIWVKKSHLRAFRITKSVGDLFGFSNWLLGLYNVIRVSFLLYSFTDNKIFTPSGEPDVWLHTSGLLWMVSMPLMMAVAIYVGDKLHSESDKTGKLVSEMILKVKDHQIRREMAATVVTYLVILVQFQESEKAVTKLSCNCSHNILAENGTM